MADLSFKTEQRRINDLKGFSNNPRKMSAKQRLDLEESLKRFNLAEIPVINTDNTVIAGNQRVEALRALGRGEELVDVRVPSRAMTDEECSEYSLRSNKNVGEWDGPLLLAAFDQAMLLDVGFTTADLDDLGIKANGNGQDEAEFELAEMELKAFEHYDYIVFAFRTTQDWLNALQAFELKKINHSYVPGRKKIGLGRVLEGDELLRRIGHAGSDFKPGKEPVDQHS